MILANSRAGFSCWISIVRFFKAMNIKKIGENLRFIFHIQNEENYLLYKLNKFYLKILNIKSHNLS